MKIGVVTPTLGKRGTLDETVASVAEAGFEHVLVTPHACVDALVTRYPHCKLIPESGSNMYKAIEDGVLVGGDWDYFTWLNDDDVLLPAGITGLVAQLNASPKVDAIYGRVGWMNSDGVRRGSIPVANTSSDWLPLISRGVVPLGQPGTLVRRARFLAIGGFDSQYKLCADLDLFARLAADGANIVFVAEEVALFRIHAEQLSKLETAVSEETSRISSASPRSSFLRFLIARIRFVAANRASYGQRVFKLGRFRMRDIYRHK
jgi:hypothetical protein